MKRIFLVLFLMAMYSLVNAGQNFHPYGSYYSVTVSTEVTVATSSSTYITSGALTKGVIRIFQNVGTVNLDYFWLLSSSNSLTLGYISPGEKYIEDTLMDNIYFKSSPTLGAGSLHIKATVNQ